MAKYVFLSHLDFNLYKFRLPIMKKLVNLGHHVFAVCPTGELSKQFVTHGVKHVNYKINRIGMHPIEEFKVVISLAKIFIELQPDIIHTFIAKPNIYGNLAARFVPKAKTIASITGLGSYFTSSKPGFSRLLIKFLYAIALRRTEKVIFQNSDDKQFFITNKLVKLSKAILIKGSGVNTSRYIPLSCEKQNLPVKVGMVARLLKDKGVQEYLDVAKKMIHQYSVEFHLIGAIDNGNPSSLTEDYLSKFRLNKSIKLLGHRTDIPELLKGLDIYCLPSYREGLPVSVMEAMACGLPIVTTDVPGCRETVDHGKNGFLVPSRDTKELAIALSKLIEDRELRILMGKYSRLKCCSEFAIEKIVEKHLILYDRLLAHK